MDRLLQGIGVFALGVLALLIIRGLRLRGREAGWGVIVGPEEPPVAERKYICRDTPRGNVHGNCAESWWEHWWDGYPYCNDVKFWCELAGGKFEKV